MAAFTLPEGDPDQLEALAAQLSAAADSAGTLSQRTATVTSSAAGDAQWSGSAADAYQGFTASAVRGVASLENPLSSAAGTIRSYAGILRTAQQRINSYVSAASGGSVSPADLQAMESDAQSILQQADQAQAQAARAIQSAAGELADAFSADGPVRAWLERIHAPWDALGADTVLAHFIKQSEAGKQMAETAEEFGKGLDSRMSTIFSTDAREWMGQLSTGELTEDGLAGKLGNFTDDWTAISKWNTGLQEAGEAASAGGGLLRGVGVGLDGAAIAGDAFTLVKPEDTGAMAAVDRGAAGLNMAAAGVDVADLAGLNMAADWIPGVGEVVGVGTGLYLGGDYLYHHWQPFHNAVNDVGHFFSSIL